MKKFDLNEEKIKNCYAKNLSGGQKRKLGIAIACCGKSKIIILDEADKMLDMGFEESITDIYSKITIVEKDKKILLELTPSDYIGLSEIIVDNN